jgi:uncharacterized protein
MSWSERAWLVVGRDAGSADRGRRPAVCGGGEARQTSRPRRCAALYQRAASARSRARSDRGSYLLADRIGAHAELAFGRALADGELVVEPVADSDWSRVCELMEQYLDLPLGMVDASVIALAERRGVDVIATLDQRHFSVVRPRHVEAFRLVP